MRKAKRGVIAPALLSRCLTHLAKHLEEKVIADNSIKRVTIHTPYISIPKTVDSSWYACERTLRRELLERGLNVAIYYFRRKK